MKDAKRPLTVVRTKFKGTSLRFFWAAFFLAPNMLPQGFGVLEMDEISFWTKYTLGKMPVGTGTTPGSAVKDLYRRQRYVRERKGKKNDLNDVTGISFK